MPAASSYDVIVIGTGAGGSTLVHRLAGSGLKILVLERGDFLPREKDNWDTKAVFTEKRYLARETWRDASGESFQPYTHYCVGGNTKVYGAALLRMRPSDFGEVKHYGGVSPAWPVGYDEFEPYYLEAERLYSVHGQRGLDPHDPPASGPYPHGPVQAEPRIQELYDDLHALGYKPFPVPLGVRTPASPGAAPIRLGNFDGYPDPTEVKSDAHVCALKPALGASNVTLLTRCRVHRLETDPGGREVRSVVAERDGERLTFRGDVVVVACGAVNSAALMLRSANDQHPHGLGNSSGLVGRNYMTHQNGVVIAVTQEPNPSAFQKHFGMTDFYHAGPDGLPLGLIQLMGKPDPDTIAWAKGDQLPGVSVSEIQPRTIDFFITAEDLPDANNRVQVDDDGVIRVRYTPNNVEAYERLRAKLGQMLGAAQRRRGRREPTMLHARLGVSGVSHQNGTLRFGADPRTSVLDVNCGAHDLENLYVVDASFFPSSGAVNPSLTIMANALRVGAHILSMMGRGRQRREEEVFA